MEAKIVNITEVSRVTGTRACDCKRDRLWIRFPLKVKNIACWLVHLNAALCFVTRTRKWIYFIPPNGNRTHNRHAYSHTFNFNFIFIAKSKFPSHFYIHYINLVYSIFCSKAIWHKHTYIYFTIQIWNISLI